jgi:hypothetical protein
MCTCIIKKYLNNITLLEYWKLIELALSIAFEL